MNRVDDERSRLNLLHGFQNLFERGLGKNQQIGMLDAQPLPTHLDLARRFFPGHIQDRPFLGGESRQRLQQQRGFADAGITTDQNDGAGNHTPAQDPIKLTDPSELTILADHFNVGNRRGLSLSRLHGHRPALTGRGLPLFFHGIPTAAIRAAAQPSGRLMSTGLAGKNRLSLQMEAPHRSEKLEAYLNGCAEGMKGATYAHSLRAKSPIVRQQVQNLSMSGSLALIGCGKTIVNPLELDASDHWHGL